MEGGHDTFTGDRQTMLQEPRGMYTENTGPRKASGKTWHFHWFFWDEQKCKLTEGDLATRVGKSGVPKSTHRVIMWFVPK